MRFQIARKIDGAARFALVHGCGRLRGDIVVNEYPKSGGSWVSQMLGELVGLPFPANRLPTFQACLLHGHHLSQMGMPRTVIVWRDGRDVIVSWYFHCLFEHERGNAPLVDIARRNLRFEDYSDVRQNLPSFIEYAFTRQKQPGFTWTDFVNRWGARRAVHVRYEDVRERTGEELCRIYRELTGNEITKEHAEAVAEQYSFSRLAGRLPGMENRSSFMRKGIVGDWKGQFTQEARDAFDHFAGEALIQIGYEEDHSWAGASNNYDGS